MPATAPLPEHISQHLQKMLLATAQAPAAFLGVAAKYLPQKVRRTPAVERPPSAIVEMYSPARGHAGDKECAAPVDEPPLPPPAPSLPKEDEPKQNVEPSDFLKASNL